MANIKILWTQEGKEVAKQLQGKQSQENSGIKHVIRHHEETSNLWWQAHHSHEQEIW